MRFCGFGFGITVFLLVNLSGSECRAEETLRLGRLLVDKNYKVQFTGIDTSNGSLSVYGGVILAPRGLDGPSPALRLVTSGWLGHDDLNNARRPAFQRSSANVEAQIGHRSNFYGWYGGAYIGVHWRKRNEDGDGRWSQHSRLGLKGDFELSHYPTTALRLYIDLRGSYSTVADSYWARFQAGPRSGALTLGPELTLLGEESYGQWRAGAFVNVAVPDSNWHIYLSGGWAAYHRPQRGVDDSAYGSLGVARTF